MNRLPRPDRTPLITASLLALGAVAYSFAGDLMPPAGPVSPTFKTLDDIEPRRAVRQTDMPLTILSSGSYYLTENLTVTADGVPMITVIAPDVTIDFRGHTMQGASLFADATNGVRVAGGSTLSLFNGVIRDCSDDGVGFTTGVDDVEVSLRNMRILNNGGVGINLGDNPPLVVECVVADNAGGGIAARLVQVRDSMVRNNGEVGIGAFDGLAVNNVVVGHTSNIILLSGESIENRAP